MAATNLRAVFATICVSVDFKDVPALSATVPVFDHGFLFGDSIYEVVRTWNGKLLFAAEHMARLAASAKGIGLKLPHKLEKYTGEIERVHKRSKNQESAIRIIITRGFGSPDLSTASCSKPLVIVFAKPLNTWPPEFYTDGAKLSLVSVVRNARQATNPAYKTGNYLNNVLALAEAQKAKATEALMLNTDGYVAECTTSNVFFVKGGQVCTPSLEAGILAGVTRAKVIDVARKLKLKVQEGLFPAKQLLAADEAFITSTTRDVMPVTLVDTRKIGKGKPGPVTLALLDAYSKLCTRAAG